MSVWTLAEAAAWLDPPITESQLRAITGALAISPAPVPANRSRRGRPAHRYEITELIRLHAALLPWLRPGDVAGGDGAFLVI